MNYPLPKSRGALEVILFEENRFRGSLMFTSSEVTLGSDPGVQIPLPDPAIAPCHAVMRFDGETCVLENCDAHSGTRVNGAFIEQQPICATDEITIGRYRLRIAIHRADATPAPLPLRPLHRPGPVITTVESAPTLTPLTSPNVGRPSTPISKPIPPPFARPVPAPPARPAPPTQPAPPARPAPPLSRRPLPSPPATSPPLPHPITQPVHPPVIKPASSPVATSAVKPVLVSVPPVTPTPARSSTAPPLQTTRAAGSIPDTVPAMRAGTGMDEDDDDDFFEPSFSLVDRLCETDVTLRSSEQPQVVEVVRFRHGCVLKLRHLQRGEKLRLPGLRKPLGRSSSRGGFVFHTKALPEVAKVREQGHLVENSVWRERTNRHGHIALDPNTQVIFPLVSGEDVLVHLVPRADPLPKTFLRLRLSKFMLALAGISLGVHLLVFAILGLTSLVKRDYITENKEGRFARIALKEIELEPPPPPPKREKKKAKSDPSPTASTDKSPKPSTPRLPRSRPATPHTQAQATAQKLLSALGGMKASSNISSATAISNLNAVGPIRGAGGFKVSGAIGKLPGDSLRLASAGSGIGRLDTKSSGDLGKDLGRVLGRGPSGQVRAQVTGKPNAMKVEGHLDRGEIQRVINAHIHELQGCFERQLIVHPSLAGKVAFEWVIGLNGAVKVVKIKSSTLKSNEATSCMQAAIRRWQFPSPKGGQVTVVYPVALANSGT